MKSETETIYVVISQTGTVFSRLLKLMTQDPYNHVSISFDKSLNLMYSFARRKIYFPWIAGFIEECPTQGMFNRKPKTECCVYELTISSNQYQQLIRALQPFLIDSDRYRYNFLGLLFIWLGIPLERRHHFVCSQFVAYLLKEGGILEGDMQSSLMRPCDFSTLKQAKLIYEGKLKEYSTVNSPVENEWGENVPSY